MNELTLEQLKQAIRDAEYLADLKYLVGPADNELEQSENRNKQMKQLCDKALAEDWGTDTHQWPQPHGENFAALYAEQQQFESQYNWGQQGLTK